MKCSLQKKEVEKEEVEDEKAKVIIGRKMRRKKRQCMRNRSIKRTSKEEKGGSSGR